MLATAGVENRQERLEQWQRQHEGEGPSEEGQGLSLPLPDWGPCHIHSYLWACFFISKRRELGLMLSKDPPSSER